MNGDENKIGPQIPQREKYWHEKDEQQKLERVAEAISRITRLLLTHEELIDKLMSHQHGAGSGEMLVNLKHREIDIPYWISNPLGREKI